MVIGLSVFIIALAAFFIYTSTNGTEIGTKERLLKENQVVLSALESSPEFAVLYRGTLDEELVRKLAAYDYETLKQKLGLTKDFCILFQDAYGNLVEVAGVHSIGSPKINYTFDGAPHSCGT